MAEKKDDDKNKNEFSIKKLTTLEKVLIIIALVLIVGLIVTLIKSNAKNPENRNLTNEDLNILNDGMQEDYCTSNIVPDKIMFRVLKTQITSGPREYGDIVSTWKDEVNIQTAPKRHVDPPTIKCHIGVAQNGEDENYYYCPDLYYAKTISNENAEWLSTQEYLIDIILDRNNYEIYHTHAPGWTAAVSLIVSNNVVDYSCRKL